MHQHRAWVGTVVVALVAAISVGVIACTSAPLAPDQDVAPLPVGTDAIPFALGSSAVNLGGYVATVTDKPAKVLRDAAIGSARGFAAAESEDEGTVSAYHVLLSSTVHTPSGGATGGPTTNFREQGQSVWMVVFKGVDRGWRHIRGGNGLSSSPATLPTGPNPGIIVVFIDAETGEFIESASLPMDSP